MAEQISRERFDEIRLYLVDELRVDEPRLLDLLRYADQQRARAEAAEEVLSPKKRGALASLVRSATSLVQIERDDARASRDALQAAINRVRTIHRDNVDAPHAIKAHVGPECHGCGYVWPCPTIRALDSKPIVIGNDPDNQERP